MPQTHGPRSGSPAALRQALGYVPPRGAVASSGGGVDVGEGPSPSISLAVIGPNQVLRNPNPTDDIPQGMPYTFQGLTDVPADYSGKAGYYVRVNTGENGLEFERGIVLDSFAVASLPPPELGRLTMVTDSTLDAIAGLGLAPVGGGSNVVPVFGTGTGWIQL